MSSVRLMLKDPQWERMQPHLPGKPSDPGRTGANGRLFVEAVLWSARTGVPWRDLPDCFGRWNRVFVRFSRWAKDGAWSRLFTAMAGDPDFDYVMVDATIVLACRRRHPLRGRAQTGVTPGDPR